jgi:carbamoyl-phosphate synthase large subunit
MFNIICTSAGNTGFPSVCTALRQDKRFFITAVDTDNFASALYLADRFEVSPPRSQPEKLLDFFLGLRITHKKNVILPLSTDDQLFYSLHRKKLESYGFIVCVSSADSINIAANKHNLYLHAEANSILVPRFKLCSSSDEFSSLINFYTTNMRKCILKRAYGTGCQGVKVINPSLEAESCFWSRYNLEILPDEAIHYHCNNHDWSEKIMVSDFIEGEHISVDSVSAKSCSFFAAARLEIKHSFGSALISRSINNPLVLDFAHYLLKSMGYEGPSNIEYIRDANGRCYLLEVNPRFGSSIGHTVLAGLNLPLIYILACLGEEIDINTRQIPHFTSTIYWSHAYNEIN